MLSQGSDGMSPDEMHVSIYHLTNWKHLSQETIGQPLQVCICDLGKGTFWAQLYIFTTSENRQKLDHFDKAAFCYR